MARGVPASTDHFIGRGTELAGVEDALRVGRLVTVTGPGGVGKTRLALQIVRRRVRRGATVILVDLARIDDAQLVPGAIAEAVGLAGAPRDALPDVVRYLAGASAHLVLDNCEHVTATAAAAVISLLQGCPRLRVLATSREALRVPGETVWALAPLAPDEAVALFVARARAVRPEAVAGADIAIEKICARLEGIPLALELAAARVSILSPDTILTRLADRLDLLSGGVRGAPTRHRSLQATIEWSVDLLSSEEQLAFSRLALFPGAFSLEAAEAVAEVDLDALDGLVAKSLIQAANSPAGELRYRMLDTVRTYARARLAGSGEEPALRTRHLGFFVGRAEAVYASNALGGSDAEVQALSEDLDNLRAALDWALDNDPAAGLRLVGASGQVWFSRAQTEGMAWANRLLERHPESDRARALGLLCAGRLAGAHQEHASARSQLLAAAEIAERLEDARILAAALHYLGLSGMLSRDLATAEREVVRSVEVFRELKLEQGVGRGLGVLGYVQLYEGDAAGARRTFEAALATVAACDDSWGQGQVRLGLGLIAKRAGDTAGAVEHLSKSVLALAAANDTTILGVALSTLAGLRVADDPTRALRLAGAAVGFRERIGGGYPPGTVEELESVRTQAAQSLGSAAAEAGWQAGLSTDPARSAELIEDRPPRPTRSPLTARQLEVGRMVADGLTNGQIAAQLFLSERTVENHVFNALTSLGLHNRVQLATWVREHAAAIP